MKQASLGATILCLFLLWATGAAARADDCSSQFIAVISTVHHYIEDGRGEVYQFDSGDQRLVDNTFKVMDDIRICDSSMAGVEMYTLQDMNSGMRVVTRHLCNAVHGGC